MRTVTVLAFVLALCSATRPAMAQAVELTGRVLGPQDVAVPAAIVRATRAASGVVHVAVSDDDGRYRVAGLGPGLVIVEVERAGFRRHVQSLTLSEAPETTLDLRMELVGVDESVVVTAAGIPQALREVSKAVSTVDSEAIHLRQEVTLADIVRLTPGVQVRDNGGPGQLGSLRIRGLRSDAAAVLVDGLRFRDAASTQSDATAFFSNLHFVAADRVEVLRGSGSSLYGTNAVGGAVNIVTQAGGGPLGGEAQIEYGALGQIRARGSVAGGALAGRLAFAGGALGLDVRDGLDGDDAARSTGGHGMLRFQIDRATSVSARYFGSGDRVATNTSPTASGIPAASIPDRTIVDAVAVSPEDIDRFNDGEPFEIGPATFFPARNDADARRTSSFQTVALRVDRQVSPAVLWQASYQRVHTARAHRNGPDGPGFQSLAESVSEFAGDIDTIDVRATAQSARGVTATAGYEFEREGYFEHLDDNLPAPARLVTETRISQRSHAVFGAVQWALMGRRLQVSVSGRAQAFRVRSPRFSTAGATNPYEDVEVGQPPRALTGDLSAAYFVAASGTKVRAHVGNAYRAPALYERYGGGFFSDPVTEIVMFSPFGDPRLSPDRYRSFDAGVDQYAFGDRLLVSATAFVIDVASLTAFDFSGGIRPDDDPFGRSSGYLNGAGGFSRGLELELDARPLSSLRIQAGYAYTDAETAEDISVEDFFKVPGVLTHTASVAVTHQWRGRVETVVDVFHGSASYGALFAAGRARAFRFPGFTTVGVTAAYRVPRRSAAPLRLYLKLDNLFDDTYYLGGWRGLGRTAVLGASLGF
jgi:iron complex outermembrane receptor protein